MLRIQINPGSHEFLGRLQGFGTFILSNCYTVYFLRSLLFVFIIRKSADTRLYCICIEVSGENHDTEVGGLETNFMSGHMMATACTSPYLYFGCLLLPRLLLQLVMWWCSTVHFPPGDCVTIVCFAFRSCFAWLWGFGAQS